MKIGIVTYHRSHNYGALLQAIATRLLLESLGHNAYYIDYAPKAHLNMYSTFSFSMMLRKRRGALKYLWDCIKYYKYRKQRILIFKQFIERYIEPYVCKCSDRFDLVIYGSDQIWRKQKWLNDYDPFYFGKNGIEAKAHISYAASMGRMPKTSSDNKRLKELLAYLDKISVREDELKVLVEKLGYNATLCLDPTLLLPRNAWIQQFSSKWTPKEPYVFFYDLFPNSFDLNQLYSFAKKKSLKLIILHAEAKKKDNDNELSYVGPDAFFNFIQHAEFVFSSSFHGVVFSIIFHKQFLAAFGNNSGRAYSLLEKVGLSERLLSPMSPISSKLDTINFGEVEKKLDTLRMDSITYIKNVIEKYK